MDVRLLGAVEAWDSDQLVDLGPRKQRLAFAILALEANRLVTVNRLVQLTWGESPPPTAHHAIQVRVSALRAILSASPSESGEMVIVTRGAAYMLKTAPNTVDVYRFRALVTAAASSNNDSTRVEQLRTALALWHGPPLVDVVTPDISDQLCRGLEEARLNAAEECYDAELRLGRHVTIVDELTELAAQFPLRHRLQTQLMLALYRSGRGPEALEVYRVVRLRLADECGLEPERSLRDLQELILHEDPRLDGVARSSWIAPTIDGAAFPPVLEDPSVLEETVRGFPDIETTAHPQDAYPGVPLPAENERGGNPPGHRPFVADAALAFLLTTLVIAALWLASGPMWNALNALGSSGGLLRALWFVTAALICLPLVFRRRHPLAVLVVVGVAFAVFRLSEGPEATFVAVPTLIAFYSAGVYAWPVRRGAWVRAGVLIAVGTMLVASPFDSGYLESGDMPEEEELRLLKLAAARL